MSIPKTIIHFSQDFTKGKPQLGGFSRIYNLCSDANRHIIYTISTTIDKVDEYSIDTIKIVQIPVKERPTGIFNQFKLYKTIGKKICEHIKINNIEPDLFFGHSHQGNFLILQFVKNNLFPKKNILWEANGIGGCPKVNKPFKHMLANRVQYYLQKYVFKKCDVIVAQTIQSKEFIAKEFRIKNNKIEVVPNAIVIPKHEISLKKEVRAVKKVLCFGLFDQLNGIPFLIDVIKSHSFKDIDFAFAGFGKYVDEVISLEKNTKNKTTYLGQLPYKDMMAVLPKYDYFIIPRLDTLGAQLYIPTKLLEGMLLGVVPICSNVQGMTCVVTDNEDGLIFPKENKQALINVLNTLPSTSENKFLIWQKNAINKVVKEYNWSNNYILLNKIYSKYSA